MAGEQDQGQEKTLEPTERRKQEARKRGQVPRSKEVVAAFTLAVTAAAMLAWAGEMGVGLRAVFVACYGRVPSGELSVSEVGDLLRVVVRAMTWILAVPLGAAWLAAAFVEAVQGQGTFNSEEPIKLDWKRLDVVQNFKSQFVSLKPLVELGKGLAKLVVVGALIAFGLDERLGLLAGLARLPVGALPGAYHEIAIFVLSRALPVAAVVAVLDYGYQWYENHEQLKMTREEMKEEQKKSEGDPHVRAARRQRMRQIAMQTTLANVRKADVVITNPTHYAVALRYRREESAAPVVVARGVDHLALKIRAEAARHDIPVVENRPLARALYRECREGQLIPEELYAAVARVLAVIYRRRRRRP